MPRPSAVSMARGSTSLSALTDGAQTAEFEQTLNRFYSKYVDPPSPSVPLSSHSKTRRHHIQRTEQAPIYLADPLLAERVQLERKALEKQTARHRSLHMRANNNQQKTLQYIADHPEILQTQLTQERIFPHPVASYVVYPETAEMADRMAVQSREMGIPPLVNVKNMVETRSEAKRQRRPSSATASTRVLMADPAASRRTLQSR